MYGDVCLDFPSVTTLATSLFAGFNGYTCLRKRAQSLTDWRRCLSLKAPGQLSMWELRQGAISGHVFIFDGRPMFMRRIVPCPLRNVQIVSTLGRDLLSMLADWFFVSYWLNLDIWHKESKFWWSLRSLQGSSPMFQNSVMLVSGHPYWTSILFRKGLYVYSRMTGVIHYHCLRYTVLVACGLHFIR